MQFAGQEIWAWIVLAVAIPVAVWYDLRKGIIPNWVTLPALVLGLAVHWFLGGWDGNETHPLGLSGALLGLLAGGGPMCVAFFMGGIGGSDVKLMSLVGALTGWRFAIAVLMYSFIAAAIIAIVIVIRKKVARRTLSRVWNFLWLLAVTAKPSNPASPDSPKVAFAAAIAVGFVAAAVEAVGCGSFLLRM